MTAFTPDDLRALAAPVPPGLTDRVFGRWVEVPTPLGPAYVAYADRGVQLLRPVDHQDRAAFAEVYRTRFGRPLRPVEVGPDDLAAALRGEVAPRLDLAGLSGFARAVLAATARIPAGEVRPYGWVAQAAGHPRAVRAAGTVLARNPVPLLVPCHRVVRGDGSLGQYLFGPARKAALLRAEGADVPDPVA